MGFGRESCAAFVHRFEKKGRSSKLAVDMGHLSRGRKGRKGQRGVEDEPSDLSVGKLSLRVFRAFRGLSTKQTKDTKEKADTQRTRRRRGSSQLPRPQPLSRADCGPDPRG